MSLSQCDNWRSQSDVMGQQLPPRSLACARKSRPCYSRDIPSRMFHEVSGSGHQTNAVATLELGRLTGRTEHQRFQLRALDLAVGSARN